MRALALFLVSALLIPQAAMAVITFTQLDDDVFVVSHRVKILGLRGKAMKLAYTKTASLCVAAGYSHFKILSQESESGQSDDVANASIRAQFYFTDGVERVACERNAEADYIEQASVKLAKMGYQPPDPSEAEAAEAQGTAVGDGTCTIEQIAGMARSGLSDEQILAACGG